jgi:DNA-binding response OmpR family regulator
MKAVILQVEDNAHILKVNRRALEAEGYNVLDAPTASRARELFVSERPDLIILDIMLPDGNGLSFCGEIRAMPGGNDTPILMLSAKKEKPEIREGLDIGADYYLTKPYDLNMCSRPAWKSCCAALQVRIPPQTV